MAINLAPENLDELDRQDRDLLVLTPFDDERPLKGLNGLVDWRFNGSLSRLLMTEVLSTSPGERTLMPSNHRIPANRVLVYGLGLAKNFDNLIFADVVRDLFEVIAKLKAPGCMMTIPGSHYNSDYLLERLAILIKTSRQLYSGDITLLISSSENLRDIQAKFDLLQDEIDKVLGPNQKGKKS